MTDLISRADAIEAIFKVGHEHVEENVIPLGAVTDYSDAIKALPSAEAEPSLKAIKRQIDEHWYLDPPSAEAKDDLISREDAVNEVRISTFTTLDPDEREMMIRLIPSAEAVSFDDAMQIRNTILFKEYMRGRRDAEAVQRWIPCSERLPIPPTFCLVTTDGSHGDVIDIALYMSDGWHKASEVLAWMPLPKPYREDGEA